MERTTWLSAPFSDITMKKIGLLSDTHSFWDDRYVQYFSDCDEIWHAGDIGDISIVERLQCIAHLRAVSGNIDHGEVKRCCQELAIFELENVKVLMTHIGGYPGRYSLGMKHMLKEKEIKLFISGHSHILRVIYDQELQMLHINPGAAGVQGWQHKRTLVRFELAEGNISNLEIIELGK